MLFKKNKPLNILIMKTLNTQIKLVLLFIFLIPMISSYAQNDSNKKKLFVRVFSTKGEKMEKGQVIFVRDSFLGLRRNSENIEINVKDIGLIKTKRSTGHYVLVGSLIGGVSGAVIGAATSKEETKTVNGWFFVEYEYEYKSGMSAGEGAAIGGATGLAGGALIGLGTSMFKNSETFSIEGDLSKFKIFKDTMEKR